MPAAPSEWRRIIQSRRFSAERHFVERCTLQFRAEALNFTNHASFAPPNTQQGSATFGEVTSLVAGNQARIIQLGLHLKF